MTTEKMIRDLEATKKSFEGKFVGTGEVNVAWMIEDIIKFIKSQESDAELGRAVRKAFEEGYSVMRDDGDFEETFDNDIVYEYDLKTIAINEKNLLKWAKEVE